MILSSHRGVVSRRMLIAVAAALVPVIAGCEAGNDAPTLQWHQPTDGTFAHVGKNITISNAFVLGPPIGTVLRRGENTGFYLGLVNVGTQPDRLVAIRAPGIAQAVRLPAGGVVLRSGSRVLLTGPEPAVVLDKLVRPLAGGSAITLYLLFKKAGSKRLTVPVMPMTSNYDTFSPVPSATPTPSPSGTASPGATPGSSSPGR